MCGGLHRLGDWEGVGMCSGCEKGGGVKGSG